MGARYDRALSHEVESLLSNDGALRFLITETPGLSPDDTYALDIQIREDNVLMYYHGTTRLLSLQFHRRSPKSPLSIKADAAGAYGKYKECSRQFYDLKKDWALSDISNFRTAWTAYLKVAIPAAKDRYYGNRREGFWQNRLCVELGRNWTLASDWLVVDRECVIGFNSTAEKIKHYEKAFKPAMAIKGALQAADAPKWGEQDEKRFGDEVDMLAIDKTGSLVVIELKHGVNTSGIYWGPLQAGVYHAAFKDAPSEVYSGIKALIAQKIRLGLLPGAAAIMIPSALTLGDPMLAIAVPNRNSGCWDKMLEVCQKTRDWPLRVALIELQNGRSAIFQCEADRLALQCCMESIKGS